MASGLAAVDWRQPWLAPYRRLGERVAATVERGASVAQALNEALLEVAAPVLAAGPLQFVSQSELPEGEAYEAYIFRTACVPTRDNLHDLFNGLVWLRHPVLKRRLNELQAEQIRAAGVGATRGPVRDGLTLFDESAALWRAPALLVEALKRRDWQALFIDHRAYWREAELTLFGHALMEKLVRPYKAVTAQVFVVPPGAPPDLGLDAPTLAGKPFLPLPVLGVPGWWPDNEAPGFYDDPAVFRVAR